jgi:glucose-1-phosphate thymidylyltransferase
VSMNLFRFEYDLILPMLETTPLHPIRNEKELPTAVTLLAQSDPEAVKAIPISENVPDLTSLEDIEIIQTFVRENFPDPLF